MLTNYKVAKKNKEPLPPPPKKRPRRRKVPPKDKIKKPSVNINTHSKEGDLPAIDENVEESKEELK